MKLNESDSNFCCILYYTIVIQMHLQIPDFTTSFLAMVLFISQNLTESSKVIVGSIKIKVSFFLNVYQKLIVLFHYCFDTRIIFIS